MEFYVAGEKKRMEFHIVGEKKGHMESILLGRERETQGLHVREKKGRMKSYGPGKRVCHPKNGFHDCCGKREKYAGKVRIPFVFLPLFQIGEKQENSGHMAWIGSLP